MKLKKSVEEIHQGIEQIEPASNQHWAFKFTYPSGYSDEWWCAKDEAKTLQDALALAKEAYIRRAKLHPPLKAANDPLPVPRES